MTFVRDREAGLSLVETLVALVLTAGIASLASHAFPLAKSVIDKQKSASAQRQMQDRAAVIWADDMFRLRHVTMNGRARIGLSPRSLIVPATGRESGAQVLLNYELSGDDGALLLRRSETSTPIAEAVSLPAVIARLPENARFVALAPDGRWIDTWLEQFMPSGIGIMEGQSGHMLLVAPVPPLADPNCREAPRPTCPAVLEEEAG